jgi:ABC-2 type transport system ATP-binding protein
MSLTTAPRRAVLDADGSAPDGEWPVWCRHIRVEYGPIVAVDSASFAARRGEVVGLLGLNGAGKTSLIRALTTILPAASGEAGVAGFPLSRPDEIRQRIGVVPESSGYPSALTAIEYVRYHARLYELSREEASERGVALLERVGLSDRANSRIGTFSRGMRQRLGIARALVNRPEVIFLDEPTLGLDPSGQEEVLRNIRTVANVDGATVVITSHILADVERICDRVVIMHDGRVVADGTLDEVIQSSGVTGSLAISVAPDHQERAGALLRSMDEVASVTQDDVLTGSMNLRLSVSGPAAANNILKAALFDGIEIVAFEHQGSRLNDAFLALTGAVEEVEDR